MCTSVSRSRPRWGRRPCGPPPARLAPPAAPPKRSDRMSPMPPPKPPAPPPPPKLPGLKPPPKMPPPESYARRLSASERIEYASWISLKRSSACLSPGFLSGWYWRASLRYAFLISSSEAFLSTPMTLYGSLTAGIRRSPRNHDASRPQHGAAELVALLHHADHCARRGAVGRLRGQRLVHLG